jgi:2-oxoglutarate ferredoxin oxidoreductase subunit delta
MARRQSLCGGEVRFSSITRLTPVQWGPGDATGLYQQRVQQASAAAHGRARSTLEDSMAAKGIVKIDVERCKACGFCVEFCPTHVLALSSAFNSKGYHPPHVVNSEKCSGCDLCGMYCPDFAIYGYRVGKPETANES